MKKNRPIKVAVFLLPQLLLSLWCFGQSSIIKGTVTDESGAPLVGVNVVIQETTIGTITNTNGEYQIEAGAESILTFSFVGYLSESVVVGSQTVINITLSPDIMQLQDVVVVGYGTQRKETMTGSISKVEGKEINISPSVNVSSSLAGKLPGLIINQRDGWPGREFLDILIRGNATIDSDPDYLPGDDDDPNDPFDVINPNEPLVVIDGVPRDNLSRLNPADIESITVLKDASAAIYGARGANGVILVTTKQGLKGLPMFNFTYSYAINKPTNIPDMMDAALFAEVYNEAEWYRQRRPDMSNFTPFFTDEAIQKYRDGSNPSVYPNTDWPGEITKNHSYMRKMNLQASGGTENIRYMLSFGMTDQDGNFKNNPTHYKQYNTRVRIDVDLTKNLILGANINAILNDRTYASEPVDFVGILRSNPTLVAVYPNGLIAPGRFRNNPLLIERRGYDKTEDYPIYTTFTASYEVPFVKNLNLDASYNYDMRNEFQKLFKKPFHYHEYNVQTGAYDRIESGTTIELTDTYRKWTTSLFNFRVSYKITISQDHNISAMVGTEQQKWKFSWAQAYRKNFVSPAIPQIDAGSTDSEDKNNRGSAAETAYNNYFGRANYDFKRKYLLEFVFRYDGSQVFPEGNRYGFFPAVSAGWRLSEEDFFENLPFISELKLRGSYGELGNDRVPQWQYFQAFEFGDNYVFGSSDVPGIFSSTMPNPNITWEVSKKLDYGLVAELWDGLIGADFTVFKEKRSNILLARNLSVSHVFGFPDLPDENIGEVNNGGFELVLSHRNTFGDLVYSVNANTTFARSEIIFMDEVPPAEPYQTETGHPIGSGLYYKSDGIFNTQEELDNYPHGAGAQVGDIKVLDLNGDSVINDEDRYRTNNSPIPEYIFGLTTMFQYKWFDLTLFFQGQTNAYSYDYSLTQFGQQDLDNNTVYRATNRWTVDNQEGAAMPRANGWEPGATDFFLYDATFIRLKNAELGISLPGTIVSKVNLKNVRVFVNGTNLLTWAKEITWKDPELRSGDFTEYPPLRIVNFGVDVKF
ncbi:SusC/RagA family TonB-linked outer membrane protein [Bacteroidota bacterium]